MNSFYTPCRHFSFVFAGTVLLSAAALAGPTNTDAEAQARFRQDMAFCDSGRSSQALDVCRREARNALADAKRGRLTDTAPDQQTNNAVQRCTAFKGDDRSACEARVFNPSRVEGSVEGGGLLRESVVIVPAQ